ncbi:EamA family transporter [Variovorax sp. M-6]|uniref:EamA family transporter n=1 Tax=Variovorax sp. M-6 TaxID=3233041 RepID=UPI003F964101
MHIRPRDLLLAFVLVVTWGASFTVIKLGLGDVPPMLLGCLRYLLSAFPALFFFERPRIARRWWLAYGLTVGVGQFALLFLAVMLGLPAGIASVALQAQAFFTLILARFFLGETIRWIQWAGMAMACLGLWLLMAPISHGMNEITPAAFALVLGAAASWAASNVVLKQAKQAVRHPERFDILGFIVWTSLIPPLPFAMLSWGLGEVPSAWSAISGITLTGWASILYLAWGGTLLGNGIFSKLLARYPVARVAPLTLLVPILGLCIAWFVLGEQIDARQYAGCAIIMAGLVTATTQSSGDRTSRRMQSAP